MVTTSGGTITLTGVSGRVYSFSIYVSDVVGAYWLFSSASAAGTSDANFISLPEKVQLTDISMLATPTVSTISQCFMNNIGSGVCIQVTNALYSNTNRAIPHAWFNPGLFQIKQM